MRGKTTVKTRLLMIYAERVRAFALNSRLYFDVRGGTMEIDNGSYCYK